MTEQKLLECARHYDAYLVECNAGVARIDKSKEPRNAPCILPADRGAIWGHLRWMCRRIPQLVTEGKREKAMRWLGFVQGVLWCDGEFSIEGLRTHSRKE